MDTPHRGCADDRPHDDVVADRHEREVGDERHPEAAGDEALHREVVVGLERDPGFEAGFLARADEDARVGATFGRAEDPFVLGELGEIHRPAARQRMVGGQHERHGVVEEMHRLELGLGCDAVVRSVDDDRDVGVTAAQRSDVVRRLAGRDAEFDAGVALAELDDGLRHDRGARGREGRQAQPTATQAGDRVELGLGVVEAGEDRVGVGDERAAGLRERDAPGPAIDETRAGLLLERGDLLRHRALRVSERFCRRGERPVGGDFSEHAEPADIKH